VKPLLLPLVLALTAGCLMGDADNGKSTYAYQCQSCHGAGGEGGLQVGGTYDTAGVLTDPGVSADLRARVPEMTDERILDVLRNGKGAMPSQFSDDDDTALDVLAYLRQTY
jgi:cytochrome c